MKVVHVISNKVWGGGEQYAYNLCESLLDDGYDVELLVRQLPAITDNVARLGVPIGNYSLGNLMKLKDCIVHVHNFKDALTAVVAKTLARSNVQIVVTRHLVRPGKTCWLYTWVYAKVKKIVFVSELVKKTFLSTQPNVDETKMCVVRNSIKNTLPTDIVADGADNMQLREHLPADTNILMYHGRIAKEKGLDILVDALASLKDVCWHLYLVGAGDVGYVAGLKQKIKSAGIEDKVAFLGFKHDVQRYICQTDIGIIPTVAQEACGLSCMEYMMLGKCVVTTDNGGQAEYISNNETGLLVAPGNADKLLEAICEAIKNKDAIGKKAKEYFAKHLSYDMFYNKIKRVYEE